MRRSPVRDRDDQRGGALVFALLTSIVLFGMVAALSLVATREGEVVLDARNLERARLIAEAGLNLVVEDYQRDEAPPPLSWYDSQQAFGDGTFQVLQDIPLGGATRRQLVIVEGILERSEWRIEAVMGPTVKPLFDMAIQANADIHMSNNPIVDSFDSRIGAYDPSLPGANGDVQGNGDILMEQSSEILGDLGVAGTFTSDVNSNVAGETTEGAEPFPLDPVDDLVAQMVAELSDSNDNASLDPAIVTADDEDVSIQILEPMTKTVGAGDYYLRGFNVAKNSNVIFDTSGGPIRIVVHTDDVLLGRNSALMVTGENPVFIYLSGYNKFEMDNLSNVLNSWGRTDLFQVVINSNDPGYPRFDMGQNTAYYGTVWAPNADLLLLQSGHIFGAVIGRAIEMANYSAVHYDEALADGQWILLRGSYQIFFKKRVV